MLLRLSMSELTPNVRAMRLGRGAALALVQGAAGGSRPRPRPIRLRASRRAPAPGLFVDKGAVLEALDDPGVCLINTASEPDFRGAEPSRYGRPGQIPGSVDLAWPSLTLAETNMLIPLDEAVERIEALGAARAGRIVCYCGGGISAIMARFLLRLLCCENVALHDASMAEWARDERCRSRAGKAA
jgi:thiosulfate/3-mercaptopyruvate sulfurtransferase